MQIELVSMTELGCFIPGQGDSATIPRYPQDVVGREKTRGHPSCTPGNRCALPQAIVEPAPLARFAPSPSPEVVRGYVEALTSPGDWVLLPFCRGPTAVRQVVRAGRRALAVNANPLFLLQTRCFLSPPDLRRLDAAFTRLGDVPKVPRPGRGRPLREHLLALYRTPCPRCRRPAEVDFFVWERERNEPVERSYRCPACGSADRLPVAPADLEKAARIPLQGLHFWTILDRLAPSDDPHRERLQRLLTTCYTPRNLYALVNILLKLEDLFPQGPLADGLKLALLYCLDTASSLYAPDVADAPPRRPRPPARFLERNVWLEFERAYDLLRSALPGESLPLTADLESFQSDPAWPVYLPYPPEDTTGIRGLSRLLPPGHIRLALAVPPTPDPTFWALSYLWTGFLLGREAAAPLRPLLRQRRLDWAWYARSLGAALRALRPLLAADGRLVLVFSASDQRWPEAVVMAADGADWPVEALLCRPDGPPDYQLTGTAASVPSPVPLGPRDAESLGPAIAQAATAAVQGTLAQRGEPAPWPVLHAAIYHRLAQGRLLKQALRLRSEEKPLDFVAAHVVAALREASALVHLGVEEGEEEPDPARGWWWLASPEETAPPLSDRVEAAVAEILGSTLALPEEDLARAVYRRFPGPLTPEAGLVETCLASYGEEITPGYWRLRPEDDPQRRQEEVQAVEDDLVALGRRLGYAVWRAPVIRTSEVSEPPCSSQSTPQSVHPCREHAPWRPPRSSLLPAWRGYDVVWHEDGKAAYVFVVQSTARLGDVLALPVPSAPASGGAALPCLVIPGGRAALVDYKLRRNPLWRQAVTEGGWQFIKFRHLRRIVAAPSLTRHDLKRIVGLDPIIERDEAQIPLF